jgi:anti-sigma-K factor RskA
MTLDDEDKETRAAEYVLGTLDPHERAQAQALIASDREFATRVRQWERRLGELNVLVAPVEPPTEIWDRIKAEMLAGGSSGEERLPDEDRPHAAELLEVAEHRQTAEAPQSTEPPSAAEPAQPIEPSPPAEPSLATEISQPSGPLQSQAIESVPSPEQRATEVSQLPGDRLTASGPQGFVEEHDGDRARVNVLRRAVSRWRFIAIATSVIAAVILALVVVRELDPDVLPERLQPRVRLVEVTRTVEVPSPRPAQYVAVLQKEGSLAAFLLTFDLDKRVMTVRAVGVEQHTGKSYQLWLVSSNFSAPQSLGLIGGKEFTVRRELASFDAITINSATYEVSLEPEQGSPTGIPSGPVLYSGKLVRTTPPGFGMATP